jgi:hypothetical protein
MTQHPGVLVAMRKKTVRIGRFIVVCCCWIALASPGRGITINISYDNPQNNPAYDPTGSQLAAVANAAAQIWEQLQPTNQTFNVTIHYNTVGGNTLAFFNPNDNTITVGSNINWFIDANPNNTSDFGPFSQTLYSSLTSAQQTAAFNSSGTQPPGLLEVGYKAAAQTTAAQNGVDMLSTLAHEMGHMTGIASNLLNPDVDIPSQFVGDVGGIKAIRADNSHIVGPDALMQPFISIGVRRLPSAFDVMVNAHEKGWSNINLPRVDYFGSPVNPVNIWSLGNGWEGGRAPGAQTDVFVRQSGSVLITAPAAAQNLTLDNNSTITSLSSLQVGNRLIVGVSGSDHSHLQLASGGNLTVGGNAAFANQVTFSIAGGTANFANNLQTNGTITGYGTVQAGFFNSLGAVKADGGLLRIQSTANVVLGDMNRSGVATALTGDLSIEQNFADTFYGTMQIGSGHSWSFVGPLTYVGAAQFSASAQSGAATLSGAAGSSFTAFVATLKVDSGVNAVINVPTIHLKSGYQSGATADISAGGSLTLVGDTTLSTGNAQGQGTLNLNGPVDVNGAFDVQVSKVNWDGFQVGTPTVTTVEATGNLSITADSISSAGAYGGSLQLKSGGLATIKQTSGFGVWATGTTGSIKFLTGGKVDGYPLVMEGTIEAIKGTGQFASQVFLQPTSTVLVHSGAALEFLAPVSYTGGQVTSETGQVNTAIIRQFGTGSVSGSQIITTGYFNWDPSLTTDSSTTIQQNALLDIRALRIGSENAKFGVHTAGFGDTIHLNSGTLTVELNDGPGGAADPNWELNQPGVLELNHVGHLLPTVTGSPLLSHGTIVGEGAFLNNVTNDGSIIPGGLGGVGTINMQALFTELANGKLDFDLGGHTAGSTFDQLVILSQGLLDGELDVHLLAGFVPALGDRFRLIDGQQTGALSGKFSQLNLPVIAGENWNVVYDSRFVDLVVVAVPEPSSLTLLAGGATLAVVCMFKRRKHRSDCTAQAVVEVERS